MKRDERERRKRKSRRQKAEIRIHAHVGRERKLASTIPEMKDKENPQQRHVVDFTLVCRDAGLLQNLETVF